MDVLWRLGFQHLANTEKNLLHERMRVKRLLKLV